MKIDDLLKQELPFSLHAEWNVNFPTCFVDNLNDGFDRERTQEERVLIVSADLQRFPEESQANLVINNYEPQTVAKFHIDDELVAFKTSSLRTFYVPQLKTFVKTDSTKRISSLSRPINQQRIINSLRISNDLEADAEKGFQVYPEYAAVISKGIGCIYRSPHLSGADKCITIPLHSYFGVDRLSASDEPLFKQLANLKGVSPDDECQKVCAQVIDTWNYLTFKKRLKSWCHGQNIMVSINRETLDTKLTIRDLDMAPLANQQTHNPTLTTTYDFGLGYLLFDRLLKTNAYLDETAFKLKMKNNFLAIVADTSELTLTESMVCGIGDTRRNIVTNKVPEYR